MSKPIIPRAVPLHARFSALKTVSIAVGLFMVLIGATFLIVANSMADFQSAARFSDDDPLTAGLLIDKAQSGAGVGSRTRSEDIFQYDYTFAIGSAKYSGRSYAKDRELETGDHVEVAYVDAQPEYSHIKGMTAAPFVTGGIWLGLIAAVIAATGIAFLYFGIKRWNKQIYLVRRGVLTTSSLTRKTRTDTQYNGRYEYELHFQFLDQGGTLFTTTLQTEKIELLEDDQHQGVLYDPKDPNCAVMLDMLPRQLRVLV